MTVFNSLDVEGIGVWIYKDACELTTDNATDKVTQRLVLVHITQIGPNLCSTVAQPHGLYITSDDKSVVITTLVTIPYCCVKGVGETVYEHPIQLGVDSGKFRLKVDNLFLNGLAAEEALLGCRTQVLNG